MIQILIDRYILDKDLYSYANRTISLPKETRELIDCGILVLTDEVEGYPQMCIAKYTIEDYGDYDYDDNYVPNYVEEVEYIPIKFCPITGEEFKIVYSDIDKTKKYAEIMTNIKYSKNKKEKFLYEDKLTNLTHSILDFL